MLGAILGHPSPAGAQGRGEPPPAAGEADRSGAEKDQDERRSEAPAPPEGDLQPRRPADSGAGLEEVFNAITATVDGWHRSLTELTASSEVAWVLLTAPAVLLMFQLVLIRRRRRPRPGPAGKREADGKGGKGKDGKGKGKTSKERKGGEADDAPLTLPPEGVVLLAPDAQAPSFFESLLGVGVEMDALEIFSTSAQQQCDPTTWAAAVTEGHPGRLRELRQHWVMTVAQHRVATWLREHPLIADRLTVQVPNELKTENVDGLTLTQADGLGAHLSDEQEQVLRLARNTLAGCFDCGDNPYRLLHAAGGIKSVLPPSVFSGPVPCFGVALLLGGLAALERLRDGGIDVPDLEEFHQALVEHRELVNAPVPAEGTAVHALTVLDGGNLTGAGTLMASVAGAAYSTSAVVMRISKLTGELDSLAAAALGRVGKLVIDALEDIETLETEDGRALVKNLDDLLAIPLLAEEEKRTAELTRSFERRAGKGPLWKQAGKDDPERPDAALVNLHRVLIKRASQQAEAAKERMFAVLTALSYAGRDGANASVAQRRIGYTILALGMPLLKGTSTEMLSSAREALAAVTKQQE